METILVDTNLLIELFNAKITPRELLKRGFISISTISVMELYALAGMSEKETQQIDDAFLFLNIISIDAQIAKRAGSLARTRKRGKMDLLIAATAIECKIPLLTKNIRDFKNLPELKLMEL